jgi:hypothetical protein
VEEVEEHQVAGNTVGPTRILLSRWRSRRIRKSPNQYYRFSSNICRRWRRWRFRTLLELQVELVDLEVEHKEIMVAVNLI